MTVWTPWKREKYLSAAENLTTISLLSIPCLITLLTQPCWFPYCTCYYNVSLIIMVKLSCIASHVIFIKYWLVDDARWEKPGSDALQDPTSLTSFLFISPNLVLIIMLLPLTHMKDLCNKNQQDLLSIYFDNWPLHVLSRFTAHHQEVLFCIYSNWYMSYIYVGWLLAGSWMTYTNWCIQRIVSPHDKQ